MEMLATLFGVLIIAGLFFVRGFMSLIHIAGPNEVLVFSGGTERAVDGRTRGYRTVRGGRRIRMPLIEKVNRLELSNMVIDIHVAGAYSKGGIPLNVQAVANVKIGGDGPILDNALERLLGKTRAEIIKIAKETLEGNLRGVLASLTPEQVNEDKMAFAKSLLEEAESDLATLGLLLDTLTIQNVTDDQGYLAAIGRRQSADLQRRARIAEASARAEAVITSANNQQQTALAQIQAQMQIAKAEAHRRQVDAESRLNALVAEQKAQVEGLVAKAQAERLVQLARIEQVSRQLNADVVEPARAKREAMFLDARAGAARVIEEGRARGSAIRELAQMWVTHGDDARRVFLTQKLDGIVDQLTSLVAGLDVQSYSLIDGATASGDEESATVKLARGVEQLKQAGLDVTGLLAPGTRPSK